MKGRSASAAEKRHMDKIQQTGCIVCRIDMGVFSPAEIHHTEGKTKQHAHMRTLPLCYLHHREGKSTPDYVSRHPHKAEFEARYGTEEYLLARLEEAL